MQAILDRLTQPQTPSAIITLNDGDDWPNTLEKFRHLAKEADLVFTATEVQGQSKQRQIRVRHRAGLAQRIRQWAKHGRPFQPAEVRDLFQAPASTVKKALQRLTKVGHLHHDDEGYRHAG